MVAPSRHQTRNASVCGFGLLHARPRHLSDGALIVDDDGFGASELREGEDVPVEVAPLGQRHERLRLVESRRRSDPGQRRPGAGRQRPARNIVLQTLHVCLCAHELPVSMNARAQLCDEMCPPAIWAGTTGLFVNQCAEKAKLCQEVKFEGEIL